MPKSDGGIKRFYNTRAKLCRASDEREFFGWVLPESEDRVIIAMDTMDDIIVGDEFAVTLTSKNSETKFESSFEGHRGNKGYFALPPIMRMNAPGTQARKRAPDLLAEIEIPFQESEVPVLDIGIQGVGIVTKNSVEAGSAVSLTVTTDNGPIHIRGSVVYCRFDQTNENFRIGLKFQALGRIDQARWNILLAA